MTSRTTTTKKNHRNKDNDQRNNNNNNNNSNNDGDNKTNKKRGREGEERKREREKIKMAVANPLMRNKKTNEWSSFKMMTSRRRLRFPFFFPLSLSLYSSISHVIQNERKKKEEKKMWETGKNQM